jgi:hypothetical protein
MLRQCGHFLEYFLVNLLILAGLMPEPGMPIAAEAKDRIETRVVDVTER